MSWVTSLVLVLWFSNTRFSTIHATTAVMISAPMAKPIKMKPGARTSSTASAIAAESQTHQMLTIVSIRDALSAN